MKPQNIFEAPLPDLVTGGPVRETRPPHDLPPRRELDSPTSKGESIYDRKGYDKTHPRAARGDYLLTDE